MAPSSAKAAASGSTANTLSGEKSGSAGAGRLEGMPPNWVPMVATGRPNSAAARLAAATAISRFGQPGARRLTPTMMPMVSTERPSAATFKVGSAWVSTSSLGMISAGSFTLSVRPSRSLIWLEKMMVAMPAVKPTVTG